MKKKPKFLLTDEHLALLNKERNLFLTKVHKPYTLTQALDLIRNSGSKPYEK